ncbi:MAG: hypothetical protein WBZ36_08495 [Candidatus Nitrosopolaris sp.]
MLLPLEDDEVELCLSWLLGLSTPRNSLQGHTFDSREDYPMSGYGTTNPPGKTRET